MENKDYSKGTISELMETVLSIFREVEDDWPRIRGKNNAAASRRIRRGLDEIAKIKVELRKKMLAQEKS